MVKNKDYHLISWITLFLFLFLDDAFSLHERIGGQIKEGLGLERALGLRSQDYGELLFMGVARVVIFGGIILSYIKGSPKFKKFSADMIVLFIGLVFFGVFFDMVHSLARHVQWLNIILGTIEDGGEMIIVSMMTWYAIIQKNYNQHPDTQLFSSKWH